MCEQRNSLAVIAFRPTDRDRIDIPKRFLDGLDPETRAEFTFSRSYGQVTVAHALRIAFPSAATSAGS